MTRKTGSSESMALAGDMLESPDIQQELLLLLLGICGYL
jgi:hypothetical protein